MGAVHADPGVEEDRGRPATEGGAVPQPFGAEPGEGPGPRCPEPVTDGSVPCHERTPRADRASPRGRAGGGRAAPARRRPTAAPPPRRLPRPGTLVGPPGR